MSTVPNTGINLSSSNYRGLDEEDHIQGKNDQHMGEGEDNCHIDIISKV